MVLCKLQTFEFFFLNVLCPIISLEGIFGGHHWRVSLEGIIGGQVHISIAQWIVTLNLMFNY